MNAAAIAMSTGSFVLVIGIVVSYFSKIAEAKVPVKVGGLSLSLIAGISLAGASIVWGHRAGSLGAAVIAPAAFATMLSSMILFLLTQRKTPVGDLKVKIGDRLLAFEATTSEGVRFHTDELVGQRVLLKFFRGGW